MGGGRLYELLGDSIDCSAGSFFNRCSAGADRSSAIRLPKASFVASVGEAGISTMFEDDNAPLGDNDDEGPTDLPPLYSASRRCSDLGRGFTELRPATATAAASVGIRDGDCEVELPHRRRGGAVLRRSAASAVAFIEGE